MQVFSAPMMGGYHGGMMGGYGGYGGYGGFGNMLGGYGGMMGGFGETMDRGFMSQMYNNPMMMSGGYQPQMGNPYSRQEMMQKRGMSQRCSTPTEAAPVEQQPMPALPSPIQQQPMPMPAPIQSRPMPVMPPDDVQSGPDGNPILHRRVQPMPVMPPINTPMPMPDRFAGKMPMGFLSRLAQPMAF